MQIFEGKAYYPIRSFTTLREMLDLSVELYPERKAVVYRPEPKADPIEKTYLQLQADVDALAQALVAIKCGKRIGVIGENTYEWILTYYAAVSGVAVIVPIDRMLPMVEVAKLLERGEVETLVYDASFHVNLLKHLDELPQLQHLIPISLARVNSNEQASFEILFDGKSQVELCGKTLYQFNDLLVSGRTIMSAGDLAQFDIDPTALMSILFTSGTTEMSKGVMHNNACVVADVKALMKTVKFKNELRMLSLLPLHHAFENTCTLHCGIYLGATIYLADGLRHIQKNMVEYKVDMVTGVPAIFVAFYKKIQISLRKQNKVKLVRKMIKLTRMLRKAGIDVRRKVFANIHEAFGGEFHVAIAGAAPLSAEIVRFFDDIGVSVLQGYGLTEMSPVVGGCNNHVLVPGTVGHPLAGVTVAIDAESPEEAGEILVKGDIMMMGYYKQPEATAEVFTDDGWFHTGDVGKFDRRNKCLTITGRLKSMIVLASGKKIFPEEIESLLNEVEWVKDSMVYGQEGEHGDLVLSARFVVDEDKIKESSSGEAKPITIVIQERIEQVLEEINKSLPSFKGIKNYMYGFKDMIMTTTLKVKRSAELDRIRKILQKNELGWREAAGKNLDELDEHQINAEMNDRGERNN